MNNFEELSPIANASLTEGSDETFTGLYYGGIDTPTTRHLANRIARIEKGRFTVLAPSGQSAIHLLLTTTTKPGDHLLVCDTITYTTRWLLDQHFQALGVDVEYFEPQDAPVLSSRLRPNTKVVFWESPGAFTFELVDGKAVVRACEDHPAITVMDNTWAASTFHHPLEVGVDVALISITKTHAATGGVSLGAIVTNDRDLFERTKSIAALLGSHVGADACASALQSMSTLAARLSCQMATTSLAIGVFIGMTGVKRVFHPTLPNGNSDLFVRDYVGFNSLVSVEFAWPLDETIQLLDRLKVIKIGYGWGGTISLVNHFDPCGWPSAKRVGLSGSCARFYFGLEDVHDIERDLRGAFGS
ncbi:cystathionine beta-lyase [Pandoraea terrae]|uniref:Cystathionine beta-lyase n=1 Tax=Pandoraea terrae TaxID=1537710 RepID=A0A5E4YWB7_9BURK|nr:PLP-dependent transferase [Pandoraea terrae]VVE52263.1 cystathionine beta-lyase [Pandoraea terrae]